MTSTDTVLAPFVALTGPRAFHLDATQRREAKRAIAAAVEQSAWGGAKVAISGMADGCDLWWARSALDAGLRLWAYLPFEGQESRWAPDRRAEYADLLSLASRVKVFGPSPANRWYFARDAGMVADCDHLYVVQGKTRGTRLTWGEAKLAGKRWTLMELTEGDGQ